MSTPTMAEFSVEQLYTELSRRGLPTHATTKTLSDVAHAMQVENLMDLAVISRGDAWEGSKVTIMRELLADVLAEDNGTMPLHCILYARDDADVVNRHEGMAMCLDAHKVVFVDGATFDLWDVLSLHI